MYLSCWFDAVDTDVYFNYSFLCILPKELLCYDGQIMSYC